MRSLFDLDMCIVCKYQRVLFRDFIQEIFTLDQEIFKEDISLNKVINYNVRMFLEQKLNMKEIIEA